MKEHRDSSAADSLCAAAAELLGCGFAPSGWLEGGDEALVLRVDGPGQSYVVIASPAWRSEAELSWCHRLAAFVGQSVPQAIAPRARDGATVFHWRGLPVAVFPFVEGEVLDHNNARLRGQGAELLARIHNALADWQGGGRPLNPKALRPAPQPHGLDDTALDNWWAATQGHGVTLSATHGDYYRRNILCRGDAIAGVIDWHDALVQPIALELAGAVFEFCKKDNRGLDFDRANEFVGRYRAADGPVPLHEQQYLIPLMRLWIRHDATLNLAYDPELNKQYVEEQIQAFHALSSCKWTPT